MPLQTTDIVKAFRGGGVKPGDLLMVHSDSMVLAQLPPMSTQARCAVFFDAIDEVLGPGGTLVLPTFSYSFTKNEDFNVRDTPSTVGMLTNYFRALPGVIRSHDPNFSVAAKGPKAGELTAAESNDSFGPNSVFALLEKYDAWLAGVGCGINRFTFVHYVEQKAAVNYRYFKTFSGMVESGDLRKFTEIRYFVRDLARRTELDLSRLQRVLLQNGQLSVVPVGRVALNLARCGDFLRSAMGLLANDQSALIAEGNAN